MGDKTVTRLWNVFKVSQEILFHWLKNVKKTKFETYQLSALDCLQWMGEKTLKVTLLKEEDKEGGNGCRQMCNGNGNYNGNGKTRNNPPGFLFQLQTNLEIY